MKSQVFWTLFFVINILLVYFYYSELNLHKLCLAFVEGQSKSFTDEKQALICGKKLIHQKNKSLLTQAGLIHVFVVSGAHLNFYKRTLYLIFGKVITDVLLIIFLPLLCLVCNMSPPILRATSEYIFFTFNNQFKINLLPSEIMLASVFFCLCFNFKLMTSVSLSLSWCCCMTLRGLYSGGFKVFFMSCPVLLLFCIPNPLVTIPNFFLSFTVATFILPLSICSVIFSKKFDLIFNHIFSMLYKLLGLFDSDIHIFYLNSKNSLLSYYIVWLYLIVFNLILIKQERKSAQYG